MSPGDGLYFMSCVHPDGGHAVFWGGSSGRPRLWSADGDGGLDALTGGRSSARYPAFSLDGSTLAYSRSTHPSETIERLQRGPTSVRPDQDATLNIVVRAADATWERQVTDGEFRDERPALSPDGRRVAFVSDRRPRGLWLTTTDGSGTPRSLLADARAYRPWWSVDGLHIYFMLHGPHRHRICVMPAQGGAVAPLANDDRGDTHGPYADPDGRHLIVHSTRDVPKSAGYTLWNLYELPLDGSPPRRITPPGHQRGAHATRARNGVLTFDASRSRPRRSPPVRRAGRR